MSTVYRFHKGQLCPGWVARAAHSLLGATSTLDVRFGCEGKAFVLPSGDVMLVPVKNRSRGRGAILHVLGATGGRVHFEGSPTGRGDVVLVEDLRQARMCRDSQGHKVKIKNRAKCRALPSVDPRPDTRTQA